MGKTTKPKRLGRGLSSLISEPTQVNVREPRDAATPRQGGDNAPETGLRDLYIRQIIPNKYQPRERFDEAALKELAASIRQSGLIQPIAVRLAPGSEKAEGRKRRYELIAGERRWRAAEMAGLDMIPALVVEATDQQAAEWSLIENLQRENLDAMERAWGFRHLGERFNLSQGQIAERVGLERSSVANFVRLTELEKEIQDLLSTGKLSPGHGKALLGARPGASRVRLAERAASTGWSVRRTEEACAQGPAEPEAAPVSESGGASPESDRREAARQDLERRLGEHLGTRVRISTRSGGRKGRIAIEFFDLDHLESLLTRFGLEDA